MQKSREIKKSHNSSDPDLEEISLQSLELKDRLYI